MKNIIKTLIVMLTSVSFLSAANAGSLGVSGTAKASYNITSGYATGAAGLGVTNELNFTASGELDNGYTWSYSMELDPTDAAASGSANNDDTKLTLTTPYGTVGMFILEGGLDLEDAASQSVYGRPTDIGDPSGTVDNYTIDAYNNIQYHTPAGLLPLGAGIKVAYAPGTDGTNNSGNATGKANTLVDTNMGNATEVQLKLAPLDGAAIGASYINFDGAGQHQTSGAVQQEPESGAVYATYAIGATSIGYSKAWKATLLSSDGNDMGNVGKDYIQNNYSIAYNVNDDLSISYEMEKSDRNLTGSAGATAVKVEQESSAVQLAYSMGGMTVAISRGSYDNIGYINGADATQTLLAFTMAF
jgi:outer membrane protein OmpU